MSWGTWRCCWAWEALLTTWGGGGSCSPRCSRQWPARCCSSSPAASRCCWSPGLSAEIAYRSLTPSFLHTLLGLSSLTIAGSVTFVLMLASVLAQLVCRSWNSRTAGMSGLLIVTAGLIVVTAAAAISSLALLLAGSVIAGAGQGLAFMGLLAGVNDAAPDDQRGEVISAFYFATWLGAALPVLAAGFAAPAIGLLHAAWIFTALIAVISLGATAGLLKLKHTTASAWVRPARRLKSGGR